jgi:hypothetical protein
MKFNHILVLGAALLMGALVMRAAGAAVTNTVPWAESFEAHLNGASVNGTNGWSAERDTAALVTNDQAVTSILTNYPVGGLSFPLPAVTHSNVLQTTMLVTNSVRCATGGVVAVEFMVLPSALDNPPVAPTNLHYALYVNTNSVLVIWHQNRSGGVTNNEWRAMTNSPALSTSAWSRITILQDYGHSMFQIRVNENAAPVSDPVGWSSPGGAPSGSWFYMVKTNAVLAHLMLGGDTTNYIDDLLLTNRCVSWSTNRFNENSANDGSITTNPAFDISISYDTFAGVNGQILDSSAVSVTNVPSGLTGVVLRVDDTHLRLTLAGQASPSDVVDSISNLTVVLHDGAFTLGHAADVTGTSNGIIAVDFLNITGVGSLALSGTNFDEGVVNDGSISNTLTLSLSGTGVSFTNSATLVAGSHYTVTNVPQGLTFSLTRSNANTAVAQLTGRADPHTALSSVTNLTLTFLDSAFPGTVASNISGSVTALAVNFIDPPVVSTTVTTFVESAANNGLIGNPSQTVTLSGDTFVNAAFVSNTHYTVDNVPAGLTFTLTRDSDSQLTVTLTGQAADHLAVNSISNLTLTLLNAAFSTVEAAYIVGSSLPFIVTFANQPELSYSTNTFTEASVGMIDNSPPMTIDLSGDSFALDVASHISVINLPAGLSAAFTRVTPTQLTVSLNNAAVSNAVSDGIINLTFAFLPGAFANADATQVVNYIKSDLRVTFVDDVGFFNDIPYAEPFEGYGVGQWLSGSNGWTADYFADAGVITNATEITSNLLCYLQTHSEFPIVTNHDQVLSVQDSMRVSIHSGTAPLVFLDFMAQPVALQRDPESNTNVQYAFYVSTNSQLVIWHYNRTGATNEWLTLQNSPLINTSGWVRFTVAQDYTHQMFQVRVNEHAPIIDPAGWTAAGVAPTGSWFHMVQTNGAMSHFIVSGTGQAYLDDLTVRTDLPATFGGAVGSVFKIR